MLNKCSKRVKKVVKKWSQIFQRQFVDNFLSTFLAYVCWTTKKHVFLHFSIFHKIGPSGGHALCNAAIFSRLHSIRENIESTIGFHIFCISKIAKIGRVQVSRTPLFGRPRVINWESHSVDGIS